MSDTQPNVDELRNDIAKVIAKLKNSKPNTPVSNCHDMPIILVNGEWQCSQCEKGAGGSENWRLQGEYSANDALDCLVQLFTKQLQEAEIRARAYELKRAYTEIQERDPEFDREWFKNRIAELQQLLEGGANNE